MKSILAVTLLGGLAVGVASACSSSDAPATVAADGGAAVDGDGGSLPIGAGEGGTLVTKKATVRVINAYGPGGVQTAQDLYVKNFSDGSFVKVRDSLAYGEAVDLEVPVDLLGNATVYPVNVGTTPTAGTSRSLSPDSYDELTRPGPFTVVFHESTSPGVDGIVFQKFTNSDPAYTPPAGKAGFLFLSGTIDGLARPSGENLGEEGGTVCYPFDAAFNDQMFPVEPGGPKRVVWFDASSSSGCTGPVFIQSEPVTPEAGKSYVLVPLGETKDEAMIKVFSLER